MQITEDLASMIVANLQSFLDYNINIMNERGVIVGTGENERLYQQHEAALKVLETGSPIVVDADSAVHFRGTRPGVNLPIEFNGRVVGVVGISGAPGEIYPFARLTKMTVELLLEQIYVSRQDEMRKASIHAWVLRLIDLNEFDEERLSVASSMLKIDLTVKRAVLLVRLLGQPVGAKLADCYDRQREWLGRLNHKLPDNTVCTNLDDVCFLAVPISREAAVEMNRVVKHARRIADDMGLDCRCAYGRPYVGAHGYRKSYAQAACVMDVQDWTENFDWLSIDQLGIVSVLARTNPAVIEELMEPYERGFQELSEEDLMTLQVYLACKGNAKEAVAELNVHRNTLLYRLNKVHATIGLNPQDFHDAMIMYALLLGSRQYHKQR